MDRIDPTPTRSEAFAEDLIDDLTPCNDRAWTWELALALAPASVALLAIGVALLPPLA